MSPPLPFLHLVIMAGQRPFFVRDEELGTSEAQPVEVFLQALEQTRPKSLALWTTTGAADGAACEGHECAGIHCHFGAAPLGFSSRCLSVYLKYEPVCRQVGSQRGRLLVRRDDIRCGSLRKCLSESWLPSTVMLGEPIR